jgi:hypothetical protein
MYRVFSALSPVLWHLLRLVIRDAEDLSYFKQFVAFFKEDETR